MTTRARVVRPARSAPKHARRSVAMTTPVTSATDLSSAAPAPAFEALSGPIGTAATLGLGAGHDDTVVSGGGSWRR